jgi:succinoglycan biosynthesis transport protein ExoP
MRGDNILNTELEILTSLDVAAKAAERVGPETVLAAYGGGNNAKAAAAVIRSGLSAENPRRTDIIVVAFEHPDRNVVEKVLPELLDIYVRKHDEVRLGSSETEQYYSSRLVQSRERLAQTEEELKQKLSQAKILDVEEAKKAFNSRITRLTDDLLTAEADLAERRAVLGDTVAVPVASGNTNTPVPAVSAEILEEYTALRAQLDDAKRSEWALRVGHTDVHPLVIAARERVKDLTSQKTLMETHHPTLTQFGMRVTADGTNSVAMTAVNEMNRIKEAVARVTALSTQLSNVQAEAYSVLELEPAILQLVRQRDLELATYEYYRKLLEQRRNGNTESAGVVKGISPVQNPTPAYQDKSKAYKMMLAALGGCFGLGLALAFVNDFVFDRTIRRSRDVRRHLRLPLFLSIPETTGSARSVVPHWLRRTAKQSPGAETSGEATHANGVAPWDQEHHLRVFADGLRERLITYFEINNMTHAPKLVGVTGCNPGAGVSTLASGLAAALSRIGNGNVLFVDMNVGSGEAHSFHSGKPGCALANVTEPEFSTDGSKPENLYLASSRAGVNDKLAKVMPAGFTNLVTTLKASDYDYIIFDMPPVTPISATPRLGSYMDMVLFVVESGRTTRQLGAQAGALLAEARANALVVLNKCRQHVPPALAQDT